MADQFESNTRSPHPDSEVDDPLAELARIIGYERPSEVAAPADESSDSAEFDLEAELMRELDVPLAPSADEIDSIEADEALDAMLANNDYDMDAGELSSQDSQSEVGDEQVGIALDDAPETDAADFMTADGRSSAGLLKAIENEAPFAHEGGHGDETGIDDDWMMTLDADDDAPGLDFDAAASEHPGNQPPFEPVDDVAPDSAAEAVAAPVAGAGELHAAAASDFGDDDVFADMARFELPSVQQNDVVDNDVTHDDAPQAPDEGQAAAGPANEPEEMPLDFEEYLSTELDVFEQEVAMGGDRDDGAAAADIDETVNDGASDVEAALEALNESDLEDDFAVFDDAAEELLTAIGGDSDGSVENAAKADPVNAADDSWSLDQIEEGAAEELDEELDDMFALPERAVSTSTERRDETDELDLDLEQLLAESINDGDEDLVEPEEAVSTSLQTEQVLQADDWLSQSPEPQQTVSRDEMSAAFLDLATDVDTEQVQPEPSVISPVVGSADAVSATQPEQGDWLDGFAASEQGAEPEGAQPDDSEYYFDAGLIAEADETVEVVADIDVPVLHHDNPQPVEPDYDTDIEREFADLSDTHSDDRAVDGVGATYTAAATYAVAEGWNRGETTPQSDEVSDEYIALERELGVSFDEEARASFGEGYDGEFPTGDFDINEELAVEGNGQDNRSRGPVLALAVLGVAVLAGVGAFGWSMLSGDGGVGDDGPRIIRADKDPVKVLPENPGGVTVPNQDKAVYDRVAGGTGTSTGQPALVNSAEEPVDVVQRTLDPGILPLEGRADSLEKSEERLSAETSGSDVASNEPAPPVISPRKVRTMIVKPDGSIVAREVEEPEAAAAVETSQPQATAEPQVATLTQPDQGAASITQPVPVAEQVETALEQPVEQPAETETPATEGTLAPVRVVTTQPIRPVANAPVPLGRPVDQPVNVVGTVTQGGRVDAAPAAPAAPVASQPVEVASAPAAAAPAAPAAAPVANPGGYYVQIASQPTAEGAQSSWNTLSSRYSSVLGGQNVDIQRADIPGKGVFHRVRVPAGSRDQANALCSRYKAAGGSCFVSR